MAGIAHLGIGLASKLLLPEVPVIILIVCSYFLDIVFFVVMFLGFEDMPSSDHVTEAPWSHSLFMAIIWSSIIAIVFLILGQNNTTCLLIAFLVLSHWIVDFIVSPMTYAFPNDTGKLLHPFRNSPKVGLGLMRTKSGVIIVEGGSLLIGSLIFIFTLL